MSNIHLIVPDVNIVYRKDALNVLMNIEDAITEGGAIPVLYFTKHIVDTAFFTKEKAGLTKDQLIRQFWNLTQQSAMMAVYAEAQFTQLSNSLTTRYIRNGINGKLNSTPKDQWVDALNAIRDWCPIPSMWYDREDAMATTTAILESKEFFGFAPVTFVTGETAIWEHTELNDNIRGKFRVSLVS